MAFSLGYDSVCRRDIQHLYTTTTLKQPARRKPRQYKPEFLRQFAAERQIRLNNRPFMEYVPKHDIELPRAPAFRNIPKGEVDDIVKRLTMPPRDRFNFKHKDHVAYNDWRTARDEKLQHMRDTLQKLGGGVKTPPKRDLNKKKRKDKKRNKLLHKTENESLPMI